MPTFVEVVKWLDGNNKKEVMFIIVGLLLACNPGQITACGIVGLLLGYTKGLKFKKIIEIWQVLPKQPSV
jgi:hypothetical protein